MNYKTNVQPAPKLNKLTKADIILDLVMSLNRGDSGGVYDRVKFAIKQYEALVEHGIIEEEKTNA